MHILPVLRKHFEEFASISDSDWALIAGRIKKKTLKTGEYLLKKGEICDFLAIVTSGIFRVYWVNNAGKERSLYFFFPVSPISHYSSYLKQTPSEGYIQCLSNGEIIYLTYEDNISLMNQIPIYERIMRKGSEELTIKLLNRMFDYSFLSAEERYIKLVQEQPDIFQKLPLSYISEYINIEPQSLSRIRKKLSKGNN